MYVTYVGMYYVCEFSPAQHSGFAKCYFSGQMFDITNYVKIVSTFVQSALILEKHAQHRMRNIYNFHISKSRWNTYRTVWLLMQSQSYRPTDSTQIKSNCESYFICECFAINHISNGAHTDCSNTKKSVFSPLNNDLPSF
jgi:hypothetical protein